MNINYIVYKHSNIQAYLCANIHTYLCSPLSLLPLSIYWFDMDRYGLFFATQGLIRPGLTA